MGKVKDEAPATRSSKPAAKSAPGWSAGKIAPFFLNLVSTSTYKPIQGWYARVWTAVGLGALLGAGLWRLYIILEADQYQPMARIGVPAIVALAIAWFVYRIVQYPPFVDFLIATEAEMNKVSWTTRDDLKRATAVVLVTVLLMAVFLFGVDFVWAQLLKFLHVLKFTPATPEG